MNKVEQDLQVSEDLEHEWKRQPGLFYYYAALEARAEDEVSKLKNTLDLVRSEADQEVRSKYDGDKKPTESAISAQVLRDERVQKAKKDLMLAEKEAAMLKAVVRALEHKKSALEAINMRHVRMWGAEPRLPSEVKIQAVERGTEESKRGLQNSMGVRPAKKRPERLQ